MLETINHNSRVHDIIAPLYESRHEEIFNLVEQQRISDIVAFAMNSIRTGSTVPSILDFGAGTGNLTRHLLGFDAFVVASDVSSGCLRELQLSLDDTKHLELSLLNGRDLSQFPDESFDMVTTYSVLHHVPDYLAVIDEFVRVVKPGGIIYIDHEVCPGYWENSPDYVEYCRELSKAATASKVSLTEKIRHVLRQRNRWRYAVSALKARINRISDEGDIHVYEDDHIEWSRIRSRLDICCDVLRENDYLVCREKSFPALVWEKWCNRCNDMRLIVAEKR